MPASPASVCVLIPVWKDQAGLLRTLETLGGDPFPFDVIVVDDGSPEPIVCPQRIGRHDVTLERLPENLGIEHALNTGLQLILNRGYRYVARLDCGDLPLRGRLSRQAEFLDRDPQIGIVGTWAQCVDDHGVYLFTLRFPTEHAAMVRKQRYAPALLHPTIMIRVEALKKVGLYSDRYKTAEDYDLFVRIGRKYYLSNIPEVLTEYIVSNSGTTVSKRQKNLVSRLRIQIDNFSWSDPHAYLGVGRTVVFMIIPFSWLVSIKRILWK